jgi:amino acid adenylation domain-containing protein/non-ribosomal peptide synthase protein (TIGR01720 family)
MSQDSIEDLYPLSPMQLGMLFHELQSPGAGFYFNQLSCELEGALDLPAFERAWQEVLDRHPVLRTAFAWEEVEEPLQVVCRGVPLPLQRLDWRDLPAAEHPQRLASFLEQDRRRGFDLAEAPLVRLALIRTGEASFRFVFSHHHLLLDGWSLPIVLREAFALYQGHRAGRPPALPRPPPFRDFIAWLQQRGAGGDETFWRARLADVDSATPLGIDRPRAGERREEREASLSPEATARLLAFARQQQVTISTVVHGAWALLLSRYAGRSEVVFGTTVSGRPPDLPGAGAMVGLFINTIPLRVPVPGAARVGDWLRALQRGQLEAQAHEHAPLARIQRWSGVPPPAPLFESLVVFENYPLDASLGDGVQGLRVQDVRTHERGHQPLALVAGARRELLLRIFHDAERVDGAAAGRALEHLRLLLEQLPADPERRLDQVDLLAAGERRLLSDWSAGEPVPQPPPGACIHDLFAAQVERTPEAVAIWHQGRTLTYRELRGRAGALAARLQALGVGPDVRVGVCFERSPEMLVALLGVLEAGGAYVPLDPGHPPERLALVLRDSSIRVLVTRPSLADAFPALEAHLVFLDAAGPLGAEEPGPRRPAAPDGLAYVLYTSGSSGAPKGVAVSHRNLVGSTRARSRYYGSPPGRLVLLPSFALDSSVAAIFWTLCEGGELVLPGDETTFDPAALAHLISTRRVTHWLSVASLYRAFLAEAPAEALGSLTTVLVGGEACPAELVERHRAAAPGARLFNEYGPTEATVWSTVDEVGVPAPGPVSIGRPIPGSRVYLLDSRLRPVPPGVAGELYVSGEGVARGYQASPGLTGERFLPDPFSSAAGARMYRTGDSGRHLPDGRIELLGRLDAQVKLRGFRIEPGEIEAALSAHPEVREAAVVLREDVPGQRRLVAYVAGAEEGGLAERLQSFARQKLPAHMVPSAIVALGLLPRAPSGKIDRRALPAPAAPADTGHDVPRTGVEAALAGIFSQVLGVPRVGVHDGFFELGGDSILGLQVVSRAAQAGIRLTPRALFDHPTVAGLAAAAGSAPAVVAEQGLVSGPAPLAPIQRWFFEDEPADPHHWNQALLLEVRRPLAPGHLEEALAALLAHHDALRMRFVRIASGWEQSNAAVAPPRVERVDLSSLPGPEQAARIAAVAARLQGSLDLREGPLLRAALFEPGGTGSSRLLLVIHHLVVDGVSWRVLLEDLLAAYRRLEAGAPVQFPPKTTSFRDWARRLDEHGRSQAARAELAWWPEQPWHTAAPLPFDLPTAGDDLEGAASPVSASLTPEETASLLREVPRAYRTQVDEVLLAALLQTLSRWSGAATIRLDLEGHGREDLLSGVDVSRTVGWFTSVYPVLLQRPELAAPAEVLKAVKEQLRRIPRRGAGFGLLRYNGLKEDAQRLAAAVPRAEVSFNYLGQLDHAVPDEGAVSLAPEPCGPTRSPRARRRYPLEIGAAIVGGRLEVTWIHSGRHRAETVERLAADFVEQLRGLIAHCRSGDAGGFTPSDFPLAELDQAALDRAIARLGRDARALRDDLEDLYLLSPMQQGMLFHDAGARGSGVYFNQLACELEGLLDPGAFERAWRQVVERHTVLRTAFVWEGLRAPLQAVLRSARPPLVRLDWRDAPPAEHSERFERLLAGDRRRGFDLAAPPLLRLVLARTADATHRFLLSHHHLLLDGWSLPLLLREVFERYEALVEGRPPPAGHPLPYRDHIAWLRRQDMAAAEAFWRRELAGFRAPTPLGVDRARRAGGEEGQGERSRVLPEAVTAALSSQARRRGLTLNTWVQGAWALLLSRYGGEEDVVFGATVSGRPPDLPGVESRIGLFINTVPVRVRVSPGAVLLPWLEAIQARQVELRQHEHAPLARIQRWSEVPPAAALFESLVVFENYPADEALRHGLATLTVRGVRLVEENSLPLMLVAVPGRTLELRIAFDRQRFDGDAVERMLGHLAALLSQMAGGPERRLEELSLLSGEEEAALLRAGRAVHRPASPGEPVHRRFEAQVERRPQAAAVTLEGGSLSYRELEARANQLAHRLRRLGVGPDVPVALAMDRSLELVVAILGILKAGGAYVPLDPAYPRERLSFMLADARAPVLVAQPGLADRLPRGEEQRVLLDSSWTALAGEPSERPGVAVGPDHLAYIIYTSGSTGRPKGTQVTHGNVSRLFDSAHGWFDFGPDDVWTLFHSYAFDFSVWELWGALLYGGRLVVVPHWTSRSPDAFHDLLATERVTVLNQTPSAFRQLAAEDERRAPGALALRLVIFGGEALELASLRPWMERHGDQRPRLVNMYGITETTVHVTYRPLTRADVEGGAGSVIGQPLPDLELHVLDPQGRPAPAGVPGELYVGGPGLARGYLGRPGLTAGRFIPHPFGGAVGARLYRTGDRARRLADGDVEYLGRFDHQVKIRGFRIELGEIEARLAQHPGVRESVVVAREDAPGEKRLVAYASPRAGASLEPAEVRAWLSRDLPEHFVPSTLVVLDALPLTAQGKIDRRALPAPSGARPRLFRDRVPPRTPGEEVLVSLWREVLRVDQVGVHDDFFELGGDSILGLQIASRATQAGHPLTPRQVFQHPTIAELAQVVGAQASAAAEPGPVVGPVPLTPIQRWLVEQEQDLPELHHWNQSVVLEVREPLDASLLERALAIAIEHHDALRLRFERTASGWEQRCAPPDVAPSIERMDPVRAGSSLQGGLDLARGPLLRAALVDRGPGAPGWLVLAIHHLAVDAVSWRILLEDLLSLYRQLQRGAPPALPPRTASFRQWARALEGRARSPEVRGELAYWRGLPWERIGRLPVDTPDGENTEGSSRSLEISLDAEETRRLLEEAPRAYRTRIDDLLLAALARVLERWTGSPAVLIDVEGHGREEVAPGLDVSRTVGWFTSLYPVVLEVPPSASPGEAIRKVKEQLRRVPGAGLGYGLLRYLGAAGDAASLRSLPASQISFNNLGRLDAAVPPDVPWTLAAEPIGPAHGPRNRRCYAVDLGAAVSGGKLTFTWRYSEALHRAETIERWAGELADSLRELVRHCLSAGAGGFTPSDFPLARLEQEPLDRLVASIPGEVEDLYPLTPMQHGMLLHTLSAPNSAVYVSQLSCTIEGLLDAAAFERAWREAVERHAALRTSFHWQGLDQPLQAVWRRALVPLALEDWRGMDAAEQELRFQALLDRERAHGFIPSEAPLVRVALLRTGERAHRFALTNHHLLWDGWSLPILLADVFAAYEGAPPRPPPPRFREHVAWLERQGPAAAEELWRRLLHGFTAPTRLGMEDRRPPGPGRSARQASAELRLPEEVTALVLGFARRHQLTPNTVIQGAWALLLSRYGGGDDVVFGITVAGRPATLPGAGSMVGLFINTLPLRVRLSGDQPVAAWLKEIQERQGEMSGYEHSPLALVQRWSQVPPGTPLFESLVVFENYPADAAIAQVLKSLTVRDIASAEEGHYPLVLIAVPGRELVLRLLSDPRRVGSERARGSLEHLRVLLEQLASGPERRLDEVKLEVEAMPAPAPPPAPLHRTFVPPRTPVEELIAAIWAEILELDRVGAEDSFFELGGHSLLATRAISRLRQAFGLEIPVRSLFDAPTVAGMARAVIEARAKGTVAEPAPLRADRPERVPLSFAQQRLWFLDQLEPGSSAYHMPIALRAEGELRLDVLERALGEVVRRHEVLRTGFAAEDGAPVQRIAPAVEVPIRRIDARHVAAGAREAFLRQISAEENGRPFDLARPPLLRLAVVELGDRDRALFLTMHHIVSDGWSIEVLLRELGALYQAFARGEPSPLPGLPAQYADHAIWQRGEAHAAVLDRQLAYWRERLAGAPRVLELPADRPRPRVQAYRGERMSRELTAELSEALRALGQREDATPFMTFLAAFGVVLGRLAGATDLLVAAPAANRSRAEWEPLIGFFINTLVLRVELSGEATFRQLLARVRETCVGAYAHAELPFEKLVEALQPERDLSRTPLVQVMLNLFSLDPERLKLPGLDWTAAAEAQPGSKLDLTLYVAERDGRFHLDLVYNADLFEQERMAELLRQLEHVLAQVAREPGERVDRLSLVTPEAASVLPDPERPLPDGGGASLLDRIAHQVEEAPDRIAVVDGRGAWTYRRLGEESGRLAAQLEAQGIRPGDVVAIHAHRDASLVVALLGVLESGAAFAVLDPADTPARLARRLRAVAPKALIELEAAGPLAPVLEDTVRELALRCRIRLSGEASTSGSGVPPPVSQRDSREHSGLAYVSFTSGSTGEPKGIAATLRPLEHFLGWHCATFGLQSSDRFSLLSGLAHDPLLRDVFTPLWLGATLCIPEPDTLLGGKLSDWMVRERITAAHLTPATSRLLDGPVPSLRYAFFGGDVLDRADVARLRALAPQVTCVNFYGATETPQAMGYHVVRGDVPRGRVPLGRGIEGAQLLVLNAVGCLAGIGELGEIHVRTPYLSRGYLNDAALTERRFLAGMYRIGDLGRYLPGGEVEIAGRADEQLKLRGHRIEPGEIEAALLEHPSLGAAAVIARDDGAGEARLVAYVVPRDGASIPAGALRDHLLERLPDHLVPSAFVSLDALPLTPSRKLDRRALPAPPAQAEPEEAATVPGSPAEELLAGLFAEVLRVPRVGRHQHFFELGGHSLLATQVVARLRRALGVELPLRAIFEAPTVAALARRVELLQHALAAPPLVASPRGERLPLSFAQERLWFLDRLQPGLTAYNMAVSVRLEGELDAAALREAIQALAQRHEPLRTRFESVDGQPVQRISATAAVPFLTEDLRALPEPERNAAASRRMADEANRPFDLASGPLARAALWRVEDEVSLLLIGLHHAVGDGWSLGVLVRDLAELYAARRAGRAPGLAPLPIQYADFAAWQRQWLQGDVLERQLSFWRQHLAGAPPELKLPTDRPRLAAPSHRGGRLGFSLPAGLVADLEALGRDQGCTLFMTVLAAWQALLHRYSGEDRVVVGTPIAGRTQLDTEGLIGLFANTLALCGDLSGEPTFRELLTRTRDRVLGAFAHQDLPFEKLVEALQPARALGRSPLFQVMLVLQSAPPPRIDLPGLRLSPSPFERHTARFDLTVELAPAAGGLDGSLEYSADVFDAPTARRILGHFLNLLRAAAATPDRPLHQLSVLEPEERAELLRASQPARIALPPSAPLHARFEAQVDRSPDALAVTFEGRSLAYAELDARSNQLAHLLRKLGVGPEVKVALALERSIEVVVVILGVLKAGGAYVPLDPAHPRERLAFTLEDAGARVLVAQPELAERLALPGTQVVLLEALAGEPSTRPHVPVEPDQLAYVIYTSGSTGKPKGVEVTHANVSRLFDATAAWFDFGPSDVWTLFHSYAFDFSVWELWGALLHGGRLVVVPNLVSRTPGALRALLISEKVTVLNQTPSAFRQLAAADESRPPGGLALRLVIFGGEALEPASLRPWVERHGDQRPRLVNMYGITETTVHVTYRPLSRADVDTAGAGSAIGRPIPDLTLHVLDRHLQPVPAGVPGELCVGGSGLARGYLGRPALTTERFVPDPFSTEPGARLYRSGDLARRLPDGDVEYLGRIDRQVKIRGFRIELGEIESALAEHPAIREAAVALHRGDGGEARLVAYVVGRGAPAPAGPELRQFLQGRLPEYMLPAAWVALAGLPLTENGKVDRSALPPPGAWTGTSRLPPRSRLELELSQMFEDVLGATQVGPEDDFFALGGHSLLAVRLVARIQERYGRELPLASLFQGPTVAELARLLRRSAIEPDHSPVVPMQPRGNRPPLFFVPPLGGHVLCYVEVARLLGADQPCYGLEEFVGGTPRAIAATLVETMRRVQPRGPYHLCGWSFGGVVAFEMAQQVRQQGEPVALLALLDTEVPDPRKEMLDDAGLISGLLGGQLAAEELRRLEPDERLLQAFERARQLGLLEEIDLPRLRTAYDLARTRYRSLDGYVPAPYPDRIVLFRATAEQRDREETLGWGAVGARVDVHEVTGSHRDLLQRPHAEHLAAKLRQCLEGAR